ncbi:MAG: DUF4912 domain-containing protein [Treponema sp.]|jgi:hypothetical protein|nr:DUF4912 domain-containing protein [Treponema sp.]
MDEPRLTKTYLDSLSTDELLRMADNFGIDIPSGLERIFIIEELLDAAREDKEPEEGEENPAPRGGFSETAELPKQYNITFLDVIIRDPLWAFVLWEVKSHDRELHERAPDFGGYCLRVIPLEDKPANQRENSFTVSVGTEDGSWYLGFPPAEGHYQVELCVLRGSEELVLAVSRPFMLPRLLSRPGLNQEAASPEGAQDSYRSPLILLSGAGSFPVIRNADRLSRAMGNEQPFQAG